MSSGLVVVVVAAGFVVVLAGAVVVVVAAGLVVVLAGAVVVVVTDSLVIFTLNEQSTPPMLLMLW